MHAFSPYSNEINSSGVKQQKKGKNVASGGSGGNGTFWTVCPYCYYLFEYEKVYEECCLRCQNCKRGFHGVAVPVPAPGMVVEGKEEYYCGIGYFSLKYCLDGPAGKRINGTNGKNDGFGVDCKDVIEISDDSDDNHGNGQKGHDHNRNNVGAGTKEGIVKNGDEGIKENVLIQGSGIAGLKYNGTRKMRIKSVPRNPKKLMGRGIKVRKLQLGENFGEERVQSNADFGEARGTGIKTGCGDRSSEDDLVFFYGDDDVYVGLKNDA